MLNVEVLEASFQVVQNSNRDFPAAFYQNLLTDYPETQALFANTEMSAQGKHLGNSLKFVVDNLRNPELLSTTLQGLGTRHVKYGALPQHYPLVGGALLKTMASFAGTAWTPEVKQAWVDAYAAITSLMLDGANYPPEVLNLK